jgi:hypothetical protein
VLELIVEGTDSNSSESLPKLAQPWRAVGQMNEVIPPDLTYHVDPRAAELIWWEGIPLGRPSASSRAKEVQLSPLAIWPYGRAERTATACLLRVGSR